MKDWSIKNLSDLVVLQRGFDITKADQKEGEIPIISSSGISSYHNQAKCKAPGVITGRKGTLGKVFFSKTEYWPHDTTLWVKDFKGNDPKFCYYFLQLLKLETYDVGASNPTLNRNHIHKLKVRIPNIDTQIKISNILSDYDDLIGINSRRIDILEKLAEETYKEWFVRLRYPGHKKIQNEKGIPRNWSSEPIGELVEFLSGYSFKSTTYQSSADWGIVTIKNVQDGFFIKKCSDYIIDPPSNMKPYCYLNNGDFLLSLTGNVGRICRVFGKNLLLNQRVAKLKARKKNSNQFIYYTFKNKSMLQLIENLSLGSTAQMNLSPLQLSKQKILLPDEGTLKNFEDICNPIQNEILSLLEKNAILLDIKESLFSRLMSGEIDLDKKINLKISPSTIAEVING